VSDSVIFPGVIVEEGAKISKSIIMFDSIVRKKSVVNESILDTDIIINENCEIGCLHQSDDSLEQQDDNGITVIGQSTIIPQGKVIVKNSIINSFLKPD
jgi:glucose-1-phosphate adenylyltransferase